MNQLTAPLLKEDCAVLMFTKREACDGWRAQGHAYLAPTCNLIPSPLSQVTNHFLKPTMQVLISQKHQSRYKILITMNSRN